MRCRHIDYATPRLMILSHCRGGPISPASYRHFADVSDDVWHVIGGAALWSGGYVAGEGRHTLFFAHCPRHFPYQRVDAAVIIMPRRCCWLPTAAHFLRLREFAATYRRFTPTPLMILCFDTPSFFFFFFFFYGRELVRRRWMPSNALFVGDILLLVF